MADDKQPKITYRVDDMEYDVLKLSEEAQGIYYALLACLLYTSDAADE